MVARHLTADASSSEKSPISSEKSSVTFEKSPMSFEKEPSNFWGRLTQSQALAAVRLTSSPISFEKSPVFFVKGPALFEEPYISWKRALQNCVPKRSCCKWVYEPITVDVRCGVPWCVAVCCSVLQSVAVCCIPRGSCYGRV